MIDTRTSVNQDGAAAPSTWERAPARIKVVGIGGGGCNCVRRMLQNKIPGVRFVMVNTDIKSLESTGDGADLVQIGTKLTHGWGAGGDAKVGEHAAEESEKEIRDSIKNSELVFVTTGMGGGTGTGAAPFVASIAKDMGALVVGVVTTPFSFEGNRRIGQAMAGVDRLRPFLDNLIVIHNDRLLRYVSHDAEMMDAFRTADEVVTQGILSVSELINVPGEINVDFADVRTVMGFPGSTLMAIGRGQGKMGVVDAARQAMANPLLNMSIKGAQGVLFSVKGGRNLSLGGVNAAGELISSTVRKNATVFFGMSIEDDLEEGVKLTLIATGLRDSKPQGGGAFGGLMRSVIPGR